MKNFINELQELIMILSAACVVITSILIPILFILKIGQDFVRPISWYNIIILIVIGTIGYIIINKEKITKFIFKIKFSIS